MYLRTFGRLDLSPSDFRRPKPLLLLAYLALEGVQERGHLAELFFGGSKKARGNLSVALSRLRHGAPGTLETDESKVWTEIQTDTQNLLNALERGHTERGLSLYKGRFLEGVSLNGTSAELEEWVYGTREFIASQVQVAYLRQAEGEAARGHFGKAADNAEQAYHLHTTPDPDTLERLHTLLLAGGKLIETKLREEAAFFELPLCHSQEEAKERLLELFGNSESPIPNNLPNRETSFIGRDLELAEISQLLAEHRLVTLVGSGGIGKSRLAGQIVQQQLKADVYKDGIFFVTLDALTSPTAIPTSITNALSLNLQGSDEPLNQVSRYLADKQVLLVLDNFEHLIDSAILVSNLLALCSKLSLLITSRERLNLEEEWRYELRGLSYPEQIELSCNDAKHFDAVQLFVGRARQAKPEFIFSENNVTAILRVCQLVEGMPLALELAASWVRAMHCEEVADALAQNLDVLASSNRNVADKHKSIRASFEHSWGLLSPKEQTALKGLAVFRGGFRREAASEVAGATLPLLASLLDKSLLRISASGRYDRHPLLYQYTGEKLAEQADVQQHMRKRHARYFSKLVEEITPRLNGSEQGRWLKRLQAEHDNVLVALRSFLKEQEAEASLRLAIAASQYWSKSGYYQEGYLLLLEALRFTEADKALRAKALTRAGTLKFQRREMDKAWEHFEESLELSRELGDKRGLSAGLNNLGNLAAGWGDLERARLLLEESLRLRREINLKGATAWSLFHLSGVEQAKGYFEKARKMLEEALELLRQEGDISSMAWVLDGFGRLQQGLGHYEAAHAYFCQALELRDEIDDEEGRRASHGNLGRLAHLQGKDGVARQHFLDYLARSRELEVKPEIAAALFQLGELALAGGDFPEAQDYFRECFTLRRELNDVRGMREVLEVYARAATQRRDFKRAAVLWGALEKTSERECEHQRVVLAGNLSKEEFNDAWQRGQGMGLEQAATYAFETSLLVEKAR